MKLNWKQWLLLIAGAIVVLALIGLAVQVALYLLPIIIVVGLIVWLIYWIRIKMGKTKKPNLTPDDFFNLNDPDDSDDGRQQARDVHVKDVDDDEAKK